ncbi:DUF1540 domain-containing protein ['Paenibacillus yunnanensis' Narsing Rao et al. 2020]|uniref:DUF1540 domain-containing protein n=1 Tax=Paenibacillus tengchongensis TaxID=2608684 RepID=UPI00124C2634|nr:DUF1540 domain-containing protein [Paenibacillus tengchongensis]
MAKDVLCAVNSCTYWEEENRCKAESIFVAYHAAKQPTEPEETDCKTFKKK